MRREGIGSCHPEHRRMASSFIASAPREESFLAESSQGIGNESCHIVSPKRCGIP